MLVKLGDLEFIRGEFKVSIESEEVGFIGRFFLAKCYHSSCPDVALGWAGSRTIAFTDHFSQDPVAMRIFHHHLEKKWSEEYSEKDAPTRWEAYKQELVEEAFKKAQSNLAKLRGEK